MRGHAFRDVGSGSNQSKTENHRFDKEQMIHNGSSRLHIVSQPVSVLLCVTFGLGPIHADMHNNFRRKILHTVHNVLKIAFDSNLDMGFECMDIRDASQDQGRHYEV